MQKKIKLTKKNLISLTESKITKKGLVKIINKMNKELHQYSNIKYFYINAPHQIERVIPITLSNLIINTLNNN